MITAKHLAAAGLLALCQIQPSAAAQDAAWSDPAAIDRAVAEFTGHPIGVPGGARQPLDRRLRLDACRSPFRLGWYGAAGRTVAVDCPDPGGWRIFVPVAAASPAMADKPIIRRGDAIVIAFRGQGFTVQQQAEAQESGAAGDWIRVSPVTGSEALRARVEKPGLVAVLAR